MTYATALAPADVIARRGQTLLIGAVLMTLSVVLGAALVIRAFEPGTATSGGVTSHAAVSLSGGQLTINNVTPEVMAHPKGMPASMMPDPVPDGFQRFSVDVTVAAGATDAVPYEAGKIRVTARGMEPTAPMRGSLGEGVVPPDAQVSGSLLFQVPEDVREVRLSVIGAEGTVPVRVPVSPGHASHGEDVQVPAPAGGIVAPGEDHAH